MRRVSQKKKVGTVSGDEVFSWLVGSVGVVVAALATAVVTLWQRIESKSAATIKRLQKSVDECESDRASLWRHIAKLEKGEPGEL